MKNGVILELFLSLVLVMFIFASLSFISASYQFNSSSISSGISDSYAPNGIISGNINISFSSQPYNTNINGVIGSSNYQMTLKDFLSKNGLSSPIGYTCSTSGCEMDYSAIGTGTSNKDFSLVSGDSRAIGFNLTDNFDSVNRFNLTVYSNAAGGCSIPLKVDVLDDGNYEWIANKGTGDYSCNLDSSMGCYNPSLSISPMELDANQRYCNKIRLSSFPKVRVGASINGSGSAKFLMTLIGENADFDNSCTFSASGSGSYSCDINSSSNNDSDFYACIEYQTGSIYSLSRSSATHACGYINDESNQINESFSIFAKTDKYAPVGFFSLSGNSIEYDISSALENTYGSDCSRGCVIPIKFLSSQNQTISLSSPSVHYVRAIGGVIEANTLFDLDKQPALLTMGFRNLDISKLGVIVPSKNTTNPIFQLFIDNTKILSKNIRIIDVPVINSISIEKAPAGINTYFHITASGKNITKYVWNFGDNSSVQETIVPEIYHTYTSIGNYNLNLSVTNNLGSANKTFLINVVSPVEYIPLMINSTNNKIINLKNSIALFPPFVNVYFKNKFNLEGLQTHIADLQAKYQNAGGSASEYISVALDLSNISVPDAIKSIESQSTKFLINKEIVSVGDVASISGETNDSGNDAEIKNQIYAWNFNSFNILVDEEVYGSFYNEIMDSSVTRIKITITPKEEVDNVYLIINAKKSEITFADSALASASRDLGSSTGVSLGSLSGSKVIELLLPSTFNILDSPIYLATKFSLLPQEPNPQGCNYNKICEKALGETSSNCRNDCRPIGMTIFWLVLLLIGFLIVYIILQEWYKRNYESYLFKNKNDLFNLIHFIDNAEKQKITKSDIYKKLQERAWHSEQIDYAYRKYKGLRTGMWEIPIFKFIENRQVNSELLKRKSLGVDAQVTPRPINQFNFAVKRPFMVPRPPIQNPNPILPVNSRPVGNSVNQPNNLLVKPPIKPDSATNQKKP